MQRAVPLLEGQPPSARIPGSWIPGGSGVRRRGARRLTQRQLLQATWVKGTIVGANRNTADKWGRADGSLNDEPTKVPGAPVPDDYDAVSAPRCVRSAYRRPTERPVTPHDLAYTVRESSYPGITTAESIELFRAFLDRGGQLRWR